MLRKSLSPLSPLAQSIDFSTFIEVTLKVTLVTLAVSPLVKN
nr:MAG TPA: hypothetical protein [Caudoviricetes sp.]DAZ22241.1 MAG TPA: hypothetical protein [Caudoviricetes sp.]